jgi:hypothetical protein
MYLDEHINDEIFNSEFNERATKDKHVNSVINKFKNRSEIGLLKYGTTLERKDLSLLDWINHLQEELMDATLYCEKLKQITNEPNTTSEN